MVNLKCLLLLLLLVMPLRRKSITCECIVYRNCVFLVSKMRLSYVCSICSCVPIRCWCRCYCCCCRFCSPRVWEYFVHFSSLLFDTLQKQSRLQQNIAKGMCAWCIGKSISTIRASNIRTQKRKNGEKEGARIKTGEELNESKFWELYSVYSMWLSYANVFSISMLSICYWRPELKLASQNIRLAHTHTCYNLDDDGMDWIAMEWMWNTETEKEKKNCQVIGKAPISELREKYRWKSYERASERLKGREIFFDEKATALFIMVRTGIFAAKSFRIFLVWKLCSWQIHNWLLTNTHMHHIESLFYRIHATLMPPHLIFSPNA